MCIVLILAASGCRLEQQLSRHKLKLTHTKKSLDENKKHYDLRDTSYVKICLYFDVSDSTNL